MSNAEALHSQLQALTDRFAERLQQELPELDQLAEALQQTREGEQRRHDEGHGGVDEHGEELDDDRQRHEQAEPRAAVLQERHVRLAADLGIKLRRSVGWGLGHRVRCSHILQPTRARKLDGKKEEPWDVCC